MFIAKEIVVEKGTTATAPQITTVGLGKGVLQRVTIRPAPGPNWEVYAKVVYREFSLLPLNHDDWVALERYPVEVFPNWSNWDGTYDMEVWTCSPQARFNHTIQVEFEIEENNTVIQLLKDFISRGFR